MSTPFKIVPTGNRSCELIDEHTDGDIYCGMVIARGVPEAYAETLSHSPVLASELRNLFLTFTTGPKGCSHPHFCVCAQERARRVLINIGYLPSEHPPVAFPESQP